MTKSEVQSGVHWLARAAATQTALEKEKRWLTEVQRRVPPLRRGYANMVFLVTAALKSAQKIGSEAWLPNGSLYC